MKRADCTTCNGTGTYDVPDGGGHWDEMECTDCVVEREPGTCWRCWHYFGANVKLDVTGTEFNNRSVEVITSYQCPTCGYEVRIST